MPPFLDRAQLQNAIAARAMPALEQLAANPNRLDRSLDNRFERDDPPPYASSSEPESEDASTARRWLAQRKRLVGTLNAINLYTFSARYRNEARRELELISSFLICQPHGTRAKEFLKDQRGYQRRHVVARHAIRKRWQRLGIWNPDWGIPGRVNWQPEDDTNTWNWTWQSDADAPPSDPRHPVSRAVQLRQNLGLGEHAAPPPRSRLQSDALASEAESFIISRPWFIHAIEANEFEERRRRIPVEQRGRPDPEGESTVTGWWKERGDWKDDWEVPGDRHRPVPGWRWRHESPSPEREDLTVLNTVSGIEFTPSEVDALEAIPPPTPPPPQLSDEPTAESDTLQLFGQRYRRDLDLQEDDPATAGIPRDAPADAPADAVEPANPSLPEADAPPDLPPRPRGRPRKQGRPGDDALAAPPAPPRRSARIAARSANLGAPPPPPPARGKRNAHSAADPRKKRGRPRSTQAGAVQKPAPPPKRRGRQLSGKTATADEKAAKGPARSPETATGTAQEDRVDLEERGLTRVGEMPPMPPWRMGHCIAA